MSEGPSIPEPGTVLRHVYSDLYRTYVHLPANSRPVYSGELVFVLRTANNSDMSVLCECALADGTVGSFWYGASEWEKVEQ